MGDTCPYYIHQSDVPTSAIPWILDEDGKALDRECNLRSALAAYLRQHTHKMCSNASIKPECGPTGCGTRVLDLSRLVDAGHIEMTQNVITNIKKHSFFKNQQAAELQSVEPANGQGSVTPVAHVDSNATSTISSPVMVNSEQEDEATLARTPSMSTAEETRHSPSPLTLPRENCGLRKPTLVHREDEAFRYDRVNDLGQGERSYAPVSQTHSAEVFGNTQHMQYGEQYKAARPIVNELDNVRKQAYDIKSVVSRSPSAIKRLIKDIDKFGEMYQWSNRAKNAILLQKTDRDLLDEAEFNLADQYERNVARMKKAFGITFRLAQDELNAFGIDAHETPLDAFRRLRRLLDDPVLGFKMLPTDHKQELLRKYVSRILSAHAMTVFSLQWMHADRSVDLNRVTEIVRETMHMCGQPKLPAVHYSYAEEQDVLYSMQSRQPSMDKDLAKVYQRMEIYDQKLSKMEAKMDGIDTRIEEKLGGFESRLAATIKTAIQSNQSNQGRGYRGRGRNSKKAPGPCWRCEQPKGDPKTYHWAADCPGRSERKSEL